jgi:hypothetical protein
MEKNLADSSRSAVPRLKESSVNAQPVCIPVSPIRNAPEFPDEDEGIFEKFAQISDLQREVE